MKETGNLPETGQMVEDAKDHASEERSQATTKQHHQLFQQVMEEECMEDRVIKESNQHHLHQSHQHNHHATRIEYCASNGVMDKWVTVMSAHPDYLVPYLRTHNYLLKGDGPLPFSYRHYIAIMAASRHENTYLVNRAKSEFLASDGDKRWLQGLEFVPKKLRYLNEINKILAHRPWQITATHIERLTRGTEENWSLSEVVHAIVLMTHFHALASLVWSSGITETDEASTDRENDAPSQVKVAGNGVIGDTKSSSNSVPAAASPSEANFESLVGDFCYTDFARRGETSREFATFRVQDCSWDDHGFSIVNQLYNDVGSLLDDKFKVTYNMTYYTMGKKTNVDTSMFRRAIWNYIQCIYGIRHDDYDYREVNELLTRDLKKYIKDVCCFPHKVRKEDCDRVMPEFWRSEKIHVNLMISEARMQAALLYALRAVMKFMT